MLLMRLRGGVRVRHVVTMENETITVFPRETDEYKLVET